MVLYSVAEPILRVRRRMAAPAGDAASDPSVPLAALLPAQESDRPREQRQQPAHWLWHRSAWTSTLMACLELAKQGELLVADNTSDAPPAIRPAPNRTGTGTGPVAGAP